MLVMSTAGYWMAPFSAWQNFELFSVAFAAPWLLWVLAVFVRCVFETCSCFV
jgi:hypothetical protein